jgi:enediyne biosynthesis protein E7
MPQKPLPPQVPGLPVLGNIPQMVTDFKKLMLETAPAVGDVVLLKLGGAQMVIVSHPDHVQYITRDNHKNYTRNGNFSKFMAQVLEGSIFAMEGQEWLRERRMMQPYFHRKYIPGLLDIMTQTIDSELDQLAARADDDVVDFVPHMRDITLSVFLHAMFSMNMTPERAREIGANFDTALRSGMVMGRMRFFIPQSIPLPIEKRYEAANANVNRLVTEIIEARRQHPIDKPDLLNLLLEARDEETDEPMSAETLLGECKALVIGGTDTTSGTMLWLLHLLQDRPDVVQKVIAEADTALVDGQEVTMETFDKLKYTRQVVNEVMRMRPVGWVNGRTTKAEDEIGGYRIPANVDVMFPTQTLHMDPRFWDEPQAFKPERWEQPNGGASHRFAFMAFGAGPRVCLGEQFALTEAALLTARLLQRYDIQPTEREPGDVSYDFTMAPVTFPVRIRQREAQPAAI